MLRASEEAIRRMAATNAERGETGRPALQFGLGLHIGNVMFGNVGLADRLTFSAFGIAVNTASRLQDLTKIHGTPVVASQDFRDYAGGRWELLGEETLRGVRIIRCRCGRRWPRRASARQRAKSRGSPFRPMPRTS